MIPLFIVSPPRSRATVLTRILNATGVATIAGEADELIGQIRGVADARPKYRERRAGEEWPRRWLPDDDDGDRWRNAALELLPAWVQPKEGDTHFGVRLPWLGRESLGKAFDSWSWLLETWPDARIVFVHRDQGEVEFSMLCTQDLWMPRWGKCVSCCGQRVHEMQDAMAEFHWLNPTRTAWVDSQVMISDHAAFREALGMTVDLEAWESVVSEVQGSWKQLRPQSDGDPFHPLATMDDLMALPKPEVSGPDPFAADATLADVMELPKPEPSKADGDLPGMDDANRTLRLQVAKGYESVAADRLAIYTLRWGQSEWMKDCVLTQEAWAARHGYEIQVWGEPEEGRYPNAKFACLDMMREFLAGDKDYMLYFDADVIFHPGAPGWEVKAGFRVAKDLGKTRRFGKEINAWMRKHYPALRKTKHVYRNAGVWSCDRESARRFLKEAESHPELLDGCMEQHQFNVFWQRSAEVGMKLEVLDQEWNMMVRKRGDQPAWLFHLAGGEEQKPKFLEALFRNGLVPERPREFEVIEARSERAIVVPWIIGPEMWEELRMSLRSWQKHFADKECPIYILGDAAPKWLLEGGRVKFIEMEGYRKSRDAGYFQARYTGYQIAEKVIFTNDDIYLLKDQGWEDFEVALTEGVLHRRVVEYVNAPKAFTRMLGLSASDLMHHGFSKVRRFATHTPFYFEREKALEILRKFHVRYKGTFANFYHNWHGTAHRHCGAAKTMTLPAGPEARFLNHTGAMPDPAICRGLLERFPDAAPWENPAVPMVNPDLPPGARMCVASYGEDLEWLKEVEMPVAIYDATGDSEEHIAVPNVGREAGQYLRHIIAHYGRFADHELFLQADPFDHEPQILEVLAGRPWEGRRVCPLGPVLGRASQVNLSLAIAFAKKIGVAYDQDQPWTHGAMFAASREALMARPLEWWKMVLREVEADVMSPWAMERLWLGILEGDKGYADSEKSATTSHQVGGVPCLW